jgi:NADP-dependent aldehyde dehydrogenase
MLSAGIAANYARGLATLGARTTVTELGRGVESTAPNRCRAALLAVDADALLADPVVTEEVFGASSVIVRAGEIEDFARIAGQLEGQLTVTLLYDEEDLPAVARLLPDLERRAGRLIGNAWPTGVEVADAMVHGGPFPATSDGRSSSVGALAVERFLRPVCYQNLDARLLPPALQDENPWQLPRRKDGVWQVAATTEASS